MLIFMSGTCLVSRLGFSVLAPPAWSPDASFPDPDVCAVRPTGGRVLDVPLAAERRARGGRGGRRGVSAHAVTRPFSQLYGVRLQDRLRAPALVHQQNMRKLARK